MAPLARTQSERRRRLASAIGFRLLRLSGINRIAAQMIFKLLPQFGQCSMSMSKTRLSSLAQLRRAGAPCA